ncbi:MAG TPA: hypothetical protein H9936_09810 [Candidatus Agathobaculum intestinigallinarum]|nr:hypothetical protein [Candidatus Agathobaculum intestinigallinarum]
MVSTLSESVCVTVSDHVIMFSVRLPAPAPPRFAQMTAPSAVAISTKPSSPEAVTGVSLPGITVNVVPPMVKVILPSAAYAYTMPLDSNAISNRITVARRTALLVRLHIKAFIFIAPKKLNYF